METEIKNLTRTATREEVLKCFEVFDGIESDLQNQKEQNENKYSNFIDSNREVIKGILPQKNKVYRIATEEGWSSSYVLKEIPMSEMKYAFIVDTRITKERKWNRTFCPMVKAIPLNADGKLFKNKDGKYIGKEGAYWDEVIKISALSENDYPEILLEYKKFMRSIDETEKELETLQRLKGKYERT